MAAGDAPVRVGQSRHRPGRTGGAQGASSGGYSAPLPVGRRWIRAVACTSGACDRRGGSGQHIGLVAQHLCFQRWHRVRVASRDGSCGGRQAEHNPVSRGRSRVPGDRSGAAGVQTPDSFQFGAWLARNSGGGRTSGLVAVPALAATISDSASARMCFSSIDAMPEKRRDARRGAAALVVPRHSRSWSAVHLMR
jgi:hypothetical protein